MNEKLWQALKSIFDKINATNMINEEKRHKILWTSVLSSRVYIIKKNKISKSE